MNHVAQAQSGTPTLARPSETPAPEADGRSTRWSQHREQRKADILDVARKLIHQRGPQVTMDEIAQASGTSKSVVYRYFRDKSDLQRALGIQLFNAMHRQLAAQARAATPADGAEQAPYQGIRSMVLAFVTAARSSIHLFSFVIQPSPGLNHFLASVRRLVITTLPSTMSPLERTLFAAGAVSFVQEVTEHWMRAPADDPIAQLEPEEITSLVVAWLTESPFPSPPT